MPTNLRPLGNGWRPLLEKSAAALGAGGLDLGALWPDAAARDVALGRVTKFLDLVVTWNARLDLTAARGAAELVDLYLVDALVLAVRARATATPERWLDVGSGGGAPGLMLGLLRPELELTLIEPRQKRVAFLRSALGSLAPTRLNVVAGRSDTLAAQSSDAAISRATFSPEEWLVEGARLARRSVWVLLARADVPELAGWSVEQRVDYAWPSSGAPRRALEFVATAAANAPSRP